MRTLGDDGLSLGNVMDAHVSVPNRSADIGATRSSSEDRRDVLVLLACLIAGTVLRLVWPADMEWKGDEQWMFTHAVDIARNGGLPWIGMPSSAGPPHAGFGVWPFVLFARLSTSPVGMVQWVQGLNVVALWGWAAFAYFRAPLENRRTWLWGIALFAVSPLPVLFARKIWIPDLLPFFCMVMLWTYHYRDRLWGAFAWGFIGALIGQVHLSGFFFAFALFVMTILRPAARAKMRAGAWWSWIVGSAAGAAIMIPWALSLFAPHHNAVVSNIRNLASLRFFSGALLTAWGLDLQYTLRVSFWSEFVRFPIVQGHATYLVGIAHALLAVIAGCALISWVRRRFQIETDDVLGVYLPAVLLTGIIMTLSLVKIRVHYLVIVSPFLQLWAVALLKNKERLRAIATILQLAITVAFLTFIHVRGGVPGSDYGVTYRAQFLRSVSPALPTSPRAAPQPPSN